MHGFVAFSINKKTKTNLNKHGSVEVSIIMFFMTFYIVSFCTIKQLCTLISDSLIVIGRIVRTVVYIQECAIVS